MGAGQHTGARGPARQRARTRSQPVSSAVYLTHSSGSGIQELRRFNSFQRLKRGATKLISSIYAGAPPPARRLWTSHACLTHGPRARPRPPPVPHSWSAGAAPAAPGPAAPGRAAPAPEAPPPAAPPPASPPPAGPPHKSPTPAATAPATTPSAFHCSRSPIKYRRKLKFNAKF